MPDLILHFTVLTNKLTNFPEKLAVPQLVKKFSAFYGTRNFITASTTARLLSLCLAGPIHSILPHPTFSRFTLILSSHLCLGLQSGLFPSGLPTKTLHAPLQPPIRATCPAYHINLDLINRIIFGEQIKS